MSETRPIMFGMCLLSAIAEPELIANFDRLTGSNLSLRGSPLDLMIDEASGRIEEEFTDFVAFVHEFVWLRLPPELRTGPEPTIEEPL